MGGFLTSPTRLVRAREAHQPGSLVPHTVVVLPSYSVGDSLLAHYGHRIPGLEHRQLLSMLELASVPGARMVFLTSQRPRPAVIDYYLSLVPAELRRDVRARLRIVEVPDASVQPLSTNLLDHADLLKRLRRSLHGRLAYVDPWNVTPLEMRVARRLGLPLNGTSARLWPLGFKSNGRRLMRRAGVPLPLGREDVRSPADVVAAAEWVRRTRPDAAGVVVKIDNSGTGDGNRVIRFAPGAPSSDALWREVEALEPWFLADLAGGGIVEELVVGEGFTSPSVQLDITPDGGVRILATHDQVVSGPHGQVYEGCRFPAEPSYSRTLARYGEAVGRVLHAEGAIGRLSVDFAAVRSAAGSWDVYGLEINLRKTGTMHPLYSLQHVAPGAYLSDTGHWLAADGAPRAYRATDNLVDPSWLGRPAKDVVAALRSVGLHPDRGEGTGVVLHMFSGLAIDGRLGLTAIGRDPAHAEELYERAVAALGLPVTGGVALPA